jgi:CheY-like chemotaxis protein
MISPLGTRLLLEDKSPLARRRVWVVDNVIKVLLVEDDEDDYILIRELLSEVKRTKYEVEWVPTYEQAVARMDTVENQVYLLDYRLGAKNAIEILRGCSEKAAPPRRSFW